VKLLIGVILISGVAGYIVGNYADPKAREELGWTEQYTMEDMCAYS